MPVGRSSKPAADAPPSPADLVRDLTDYIATHSEAAILEDGRVLFDLRTARFTVEESHGRCILQLWSSERNLVRTVVAAEKRAGNLRVLTRRMGAPKPTSLEFVPNANRRTPTTRDKGRGNYLKLLQRVLAREFPGCKVEGMRTAMDLEHSFGPAYARGRMVRGTSIEAVIGVGPDESSTTIDGILTLGLLWLDYCREHVDPRRFVAGIKVVVPEGASRTTAERMAWLNPALATFELFALDARSEELRRVEILDTGNFDSRLVHAFSPQAALDMCAQGVRRVMDLLPPGAKNQVEVMARSATQVAFLLHGLEFARVQMAAAEGSFSREVEVVVGAGANEVPLIPASESFCREGIAQLFASRQPGSSFNDPLFRAKPERWLESRFREELPEIVFGASKDLVYSQVPALSSGDRGMLDLLTVDGDQRLVVIELKADEDLHLPLQSLDYWIRVRALLQNRQTTGTGRSVSAFEQLGYFPGMELSAQPPRLLLAAPALRIHPANEPVLRYLSPQIEWELIAVGESWRSEWSIVFRKRSSPALHR